MYIPIVNYLITILSNLFESIQTLLIGDRQGDIDAPQQGFVIDELLRMFIAETAPGDIDIVNNALIADNIQNGQAPLETLIQDNSEEDVEALVVGLLMY